MIDIKVLVANQIKSAAEPAQVVAPGVQTPVTPDLPTTLPPPKIQFNAPEVKPPAPVTPAAQPVAPAAPVQPAVDPNEAHYDAYHKALATQDPEKITASMKAVADQHMKSNPKATPEDIQKLQNDVYRQGAMRHFQATNPVAGKVIPGSVIQAGAPAAMAKRVQDEALKFKQTNEQLAAKVKNGGFMDWIKSNPEALMVPAGILAMVFGGKPGLVLGAIAAAYGSKGLYDRYKAMTSPEYAKIHASVIKDAVANPTLMENVDLNNPSAAFPQLKGSENTFRDMMAASSLLKGQVNSRIDEAAANQTQGMMGGAATPEFMTELNKQLAAQNEAAAQQAASAQTVR